MHICNHIPHDKYRHHHKRVYTLYTRIRIHYCTLYTHILYTVYTAYTHYTDLATYVKVCITVL